MTGQNKNKPDEKNNGISPVTAAVAGAVVGAGIAVAGAVALQDENNRVKVKKVLGNVKKQATDYVEGVQKQVQEKKNEIEEKITEGKEKIEKAAEAAKKSLDSK